MSTRPVPHREEYIVEYMFVITQDESIMSEPATAEPDSGSEAMAAWNAYNERLVAGGHWISGAALVPSSATTAVHKSDGAVAATTDGPYAETKEQVGGYYTVRCADLDEALALAGEIPVRGTAVIEVRPLMWRPDA